MIAISEDPNYQLKVVKGRVKTKLSLSLSGVLRPRAQRTRNEGFFLFRQLNSTIPLALFLY